MTDLRLKTMTEVMQQMAAQQCTATMRQLRKLIVAHGVDSVKSNEIRKIISDIGDIKTRIERL